MDGKRCGHCFPTGNVRRLIGCVLVGLCVATGCKTLEERTGRTLPFAPAQGKHDAAAPTQMAVIWKDAVYTQPGKPPTRGFGGRIYFYNDQHKPVQVDGQLTVFAFDDSDKNQIQTNVPDRKFVFTEDLFEKHHSESELGHSYSVWVPWDAAGGISKSISLVPVFKATSGKVVRGDHTINVLPGKALESTNDVAADRSKQVDGEAAIRPVGFQRSAEPKADTPKKDSSTLQMRTSTIRLSPSLSRQLQLPRQNADSASSRTGRQSTFQPPQYTTSGMRTVGTVPPSSSSAPFRRQARTVFGAPGQIPSSSQAVESQVDQAAEESAGGRLATTYGPRPATRVQPKPFANKSGAAPNTATTYQARATFQPSTSQFPKVTFPHDTASGPTAWR